MLLRASSSRSLLAIGGFAVAYAGLAAWRITADLKEANGHGTDATVLQYLKMA